MTTNYNQNESQNANGASLLWRVVSVFYMLLAMAYDVSPVDAVPDAIPVIGWLDDVGLTLSAVLNIIQQFANNQDAFLIKLIKWMKWILIILLLIVFFAVGGLVALIVSLFT